MLTYPQIDHVAIHIGPLKVHWYGIMYFIGLAIAFLIAKTKIKQPQYSFFAKRQMLDDLLSYCVLGIIIGGRLGFCLLYRPYYYMNHPLEIIKIWEGGMSFHGGMVGVFTMLYLYARKHKTSFFTVSDFIAPLVPIGLFFGRIGNFINGELYGKFCDTIQAWCMIFPNDNLARHPSQIYEALGEGIILFLILAFYTQKKRKAGQISAVFLFGYSIIRFIMEIYRLPDSYGQWIVDSTGLSLGQCYCIPMFIAGVIIYIKSSKTRTN